MPQGNYRRAVVLAVIVAESLLAFATYEAVAITLTVPKVANAKGFLESSEWLYWLFGWAAIRAVAGVSAVYVTKPTLWILPLAVLAWELKVFASNVPIVLNTLGGFQPSLLLSFAFQIPVRSMLIPALVPLVLAPILALQTYWLIAGWRRRHAA